MFRSSHVIRAIVAVGCLALGARATAEEPTDTSPVEAPSLTELIDETLARRPELAQSEAAVAVERERVPQAGALPDPTLTLGIQNDGFGEIMIGEMETSYWQVMLTQPFYFPGKRGLREKVAELSVDAATARLLRARLSAEADVRRAWIDLLLARDQLALLGKLETLWEQSEKLAKARYTVGEGGQADVLRAQLERMRLRQQRTRLESWERTRVQELNRLAGRALDQPIEPTPSLRDVALPTLPGLAEALEDARGRSPELREAQASVQRAAQGLELARKERLPDFSVSAGVMPRGQLEPMWSLSVGVNLPVFSGSKQNRVVAERKAEQRGASAGIETTEQLLDLRTRERVFRLASALETERMFRDGLLVQSDATTQSALSQYRVGSTSFATVLDAMNAYVAIENEHLDTLALAHRLDIGQREVSLNPIEGPASAMSAASVPGAGSSSGGSVTTTESSAASAPAGGSGGSSMAGM